MNEVKNIISTCYVHLAAIESHIVTKQHDKAEYRAGELVENAKLLRNALFREQRVSGEVK